MSYTTAQFLNIIKPMVIADAKRANILASVTAAQAIIESANGNSALGAPPNNNLFGIKGNYKGASCWFNTKEFVNGKYVTVRAAFRKYPSWAESIQDHNDFLLKNSRYKNLIGVKDYKTVCRLLQQDGYATAVSYGATLINTIEKNGLQAWDTGAPVTFKNTPYAAVVKASALRVRSSRSAADMGNIVQVGGHDLLLPRGMVIAIGRESSDGWAELQNLPNHWVSLNYLTKS